MAVRVGINGFGRIGRLVFRVLAQHPSAFEVVAINDLADPKHLAVLLKYDSVHRRFPGTVEAGDKALVVNGKSIPILTERDPANLPWKSLGCQVALESTGFFTSREKLQKHIDAGAGRVVSERPGEGQARRNPGPRCQRSDPERQHEDRLQRLAAPRTAWPRWPRSCTRPSASRRA